MCVPQLVGRCFLEVSGCCWMKLFALGASTATDWHGGLPRLLPYGSWDRLKPSHDPELDKQKRMDAWTVTVACSFSCLSKKYSLLAQRCYNFKKWEANLRWISEGATFTLKSKLLQFWFVLYFLKFYYNLKSLSAFADECITPMTIRRRFSATSWGTHICP